MDGGGPIVEAGGQVRETLCVYERERLVTWPRKMAAGTGGSYPKEGKHGLGRRKCRGKWSSDDRKHSDDKHITRKSP